MYKKIDILIDSLILRGGKKPDNIYVELEEYLTRLASLKRKILGVEFRMQCWTSICKEHKEQFDKSAAVVTPFKYPTSGLATSTFALRDIRLENEFEVLLYSITSTLSTLTRVIASFLKGATQFHSHTKFPDVLLKYTNFKESLSIVQQATGSWIQDLTRRRDSATHYIALSIPSSVKHIKSGTSPVETTSSRIGLTKKPSRYISIWDDDLPTLGGAKRYSSISSDGSETHELRDKYDNVILKSEVPLQSIPTLIDGEEYAKTTYTNFQDYIETLLSAVFREAQLPKVS